MTYRYTYRDKYSRIDLWRGSNTESSYVSVIINVMVVWI